MMGTYDYLCKGEGWGHSRYRGHRSHEIVGALGIAYMKEGHGGGMGA